MPDLTPMTRQEKFLNGDTDLEPITRREHFYAGRESELPEGHQEPETREEWFIKEYRGGGGDVTVVPLSVTENGTYSEEGKAYSPVSVNVPLPENTYLLKSVANLPQAIASFSDGAVAPMMGLKVGIEPVQSGSGDPSPTNVRPISGWDKVNVTVADNVETPTVENDYTIDLDGTRYGGTLDVVSGVLTVDRGYVDLGDLNWTLESGIFRLNESIGAKLTTNTSAVSNMLCSIYKTVSQNAMGSTSTDQCIAGLNWSNGVRIKDSNYTDVASFKTAVSGVQLVYELATPQVIQLTPTEIKTLLGMNNIWADTGDITDAEYFSKEV